MTKFVKRSRIRASAQELFAWHARPGALQRLIPPWERVKVELQEGGIEDGARVVMRMRQGPLWVRWVAHHSDYIEGEQFRDEQRQGPFAKWIHTHRFVPEGEHESTLEDEVEYALPMGILGRLFGGRMVKKTLEQMFSFRHKRTANDLAQHGRFAEVEAQRVLITGASGLVGGALRSFLTTGGHQVEALVRQRDREGVYWNPAKGEIDTQALEGADVVVHLAGESIASGRWNAAKKARIMDSRVEGTKLLAEALAGLEKKPRVLVSASAIGIYGDRGDEVLDESSAPGEGFLPDVCVAWEEATKAAEEAGIRVVHVRIGVVLSSQGGALATMLLPFSMGLGGRVSHGRQWMSWIALDDLIGILHEAMFDEELEGPINAVAPEPVTNATFTKVLGKVLRRPTIFPLPAPIVKIALGEMGKILLLEGAKILPRRMQERSFPFLFPNLEDALRFTLGRQP